jgi:hypothetical protein
VTDSPSPASALRLIQGWGLTDPLTALAESRTRVLPGHSVTGIDWSSLLLAGWTPETYLRLHELATHTVACQNPASVPGAVQPDIDPVTATVRRFILLAESTASAGLTATTILPWLEMLAAEPRTDQFWRLHHAVQDWARTKRSGTFGLASWDLTAGRLAPLAWAAGLSLEETRALLDADAYATRSLRLILELRGYRLPDERSQAVHV